MQGICASACARVDCREAHAQPAPLRIATDDAGAGDRERVAPPSRLARSALAPAVTPLAAAVLPVAAAAVPKDLDSNLRKNRLLLLIIDGPLKPRHAHVDLCQLASLQHCRLAFAGPLEPALRLEDHARRVVEAGADGERKR